MSFIQRVCFSGSLILMLAAIVPFQATQELAWADDKGLAIRYRTIYTEGYGEWKFPREMPPFTVRDLNTSIDGTIPPPKK